MFEHVLDRPLLSPVEGVDSRVDHQAAGAEDLLAVAAVSVCRAKPIVLHYTFHSSFHIKTIFTIRFTNRFTVVQTRTTVDVMAISIPSF